MIKYNILNRSLIFFVQKQKLGKATTELADSHMFAYLYRTTIWDTKLKPCPPYLVKIVLCIDFITGCRTYTAVSNSKFAMISKDKINFRSLPNRRAIDVASFAKIRLALREGWLKPYKNFYKLTLLVNLFMEIRFMKYLNLTLSKIQFLNVTIVSLRVEEN